MRKTTSKWFSWTSHNKQLIAMSPNSFATSYLAYIIRNRLQINTPMTCPLYCAFHTMHEKESTLLILFSEPFCLLIADHIILFHLYFTQINIKTSFACLVIANCCIKCTLRLSLDSQHPQNLFLQWLVLWFGLMVSVTNLKSCKILWHFPLKNALHCKGLHVSIHVVSLSQHWLLFIYKSLEYHFQPIFRSTLYYIYIFIYFKTLVNAQLNNTHSTRAKLLEK